MKKKFVSTILIISILSTGLLSGCGKSASAESVDLTSVSLDTIKEKAKEEGTISSVGMPDDWADWKDSWESISNTYGLVHDDTDMSSSEELSLFESEKDSPTKDIGDVGQALDRLLLKWMWYSLIKLLPGIPFRTGQRTRMVNGRFPILEPWVLW